MRAFILFYTNLTKFFTEIDVTLFEKCQKPPHRWCRWLINFNYRNKRKCTKMSTAQQCIVWCSWTNDRPNIVCIQSWKVNLLATLSSKYCVIRSIGTVIAGLMLSIINIHLPSTISGKRFFAMICTTNACQEVSYYSRMSSYKHLESENINSITQILCSRELSNEGFAVYFCAWENGSAYYI